MCDILRHMKPLHVCNNYNGDSTEDSRTRLSKYCVHNSVLFISFVCCTLAQIFYRASWTSGSESVKNTKQTVRPYNSLCP